MIYSPRVGGCGADYTSHSSPINHPWAAFRSRCEQVGVDANVRPNPLGHGNIWFYNRGGKLVRIDSDGETYYLEPKEALDLKLHSEHLPILTGLNNGI